LYATALFDATLSIDRGRAIFYGLRLSMLLWITQAAAAAANGAASLLTVNEVRSTFLEMLRSKMHLHGVSSSTKNDDVLYTVLGPHLRS
jgi:hypothetical protein